MKHVVTAQLNLNSTQLNSSWSDYIITVLPTHPTTPPQTFKALPGNLGSWVSECNLILTQLEETWRKKLMQFQHHSQNFEGTNFQYITLFWPNKKKFEEEKLTSPDPLPPHKSKN